MTDISQWTTAEPLFGLAPSWIGDEQEQKRIQAYVLYEAIYWGVPETFALLRRGSEANPIYLPAGRSIVDTINRYTGKGIRFVPDPAVGTPEQQNAASLVLKDFFRREKFYSKYNAGKCEGIMRGDWFWHVFADPSKPEGSRISIMVVDPGSVFPIYNPENVDEIIGWHIVDQWEFDSKAAIRRLTYRKQTGTSGPSPITMSDTIFEVDKWGGPGMEESALQVVTPDTVLPQPIDHLPLYLSTNTTTTGSIWGSSELRGYERIIAAMNQTISDEDLALALEGLGVYATNAGTPVNDDGEEVPWNLGPGRVVELPTDSPEKTFFERINGITSVQANLDHIKFLYDQLDMSAGTPAIAKGKVDVQIAESGISLLLQLGPLLHKAEEKETNLTDTHTQLAFDLRKWFAAYEGALGTPLMATQFVPVYADKVPTNNEKRFEQIMALFEAEVVTIQWVLTELEKIGYEFGDVNSFATEVDKANLKKAQQEADVMGARLDNELGGGL